MDLPIFYWYLHWKSALLCKMWYDALKHKWAEEGAGNGERKRNAETVPQKNRYCCRIHWHTIN